MEKKEFIFYSDSELDAMTDEELEEYRLKTRNFYIEIGDYYQNNVCGCWQDRKYQKTKV